MKIKTTFIFDKQMGFTIKIKTWNKYCVIP